jgi:hypothetical protein
MRRRTPLRRAGRLGRRTPLRGSRGPILRAPLPRAPFSPASGVQRAKVLDRACLVCSRQPVDPAYLLPRSLGGCDHPDCVVPPALSWARRRARSPSTQASSR